MNAHNIQQSHWKKARKVPSSLKSGTPEKQRKGPKGEKTNRTTPKKTPGAFGSMGTIATCHNINLLETVCIY